MAKTKRRSGNAVLASEKDSVYLLKIVLYLIVGAQWIRLVNVDGTTQLPIPVGLIIGVLFASRDHFRLDRRVEYAILVVAMFVGFWSQVGLYITT